MKKWYARWSRDEAPAPLNTSACDLTGNLQDFAHSLSRKDPSNKARGMGTLLALFLSCNTTICRENVLLQCGSLSMQLLSSLPVWWLVLCLLVEPRWWHHHLFKFLGDAKYSKGKAVLNEAKLMEFSANAGLAPLQTLQESKLKKGFFYSVIRGGGDFFCRWAGIFVLFVWWLQCLACLLAVWRGSWKGEGLCSIP